MVARWLSAQHSGKKKGEKPFFVLWGERLTPDREPTQPERPIDYNFAGKKGKTIRDFVQAFAKNLTASDHSNEERGGV